VCLPRYRTEDSTHASGNFGVEIDSRSEKDGADVRPRGGMDQGGASAKQVGRVARNDSTLLTYSMEQSPS